MSEKLTSKRAIVEYLQAVGRPLAVHEILIAGYSQNNIATRLSEMAKAGIVAGNTRIGERFKEWSLTTAKAGA